jgi:hypothetical protein
MRRLQALLVAGLLIVSTQASADEAMSAADARIFSVFHARLLEQSALGAWGRDRLTDEKARIVAKWMDSYAAKFAKSVDELLAKQGATVTPADDDPLVLEARALREELASLPGNALDLAWAQRVSAWLDKARAQAIFVDARKIESKKARGRESSLRWAWGEGYFRTCVIRRQLEKIELACAAPPRDPATPGA